MKLSNVTYLVREYDEAINWFVDVLGFELREDTQLSDTKRWVRVGAVGSETSLLLAKADSPNQLASISNVAGGRVGFFLHTDEFDVMLQRLIDKAVKLKGEPRTEIYGRVVVFEDLYGNPWDLIGLPAQKP